MACNAGGLILTPTDPLFQESPLPAEDQLLIELYLRLGVPTDQLAYTDEFEALYKALEDAGDTRDRRMVYRRLLNLRKAGRLPRLEAA